MQIAGCGDIIRDHPHIFLKLNSLDHFGRCRSAVNQQRIPSSIKATAFSPDRLFNGDIGMAFVKIGRLRTKMMRRERSAMKCAQQALSFQASPDRA